MEIKRLGKGSCGTVDLISIIDSRSKKKTFYAAKSAKDPTFTNYLKDEKRLLDIFGGSPEIVQCHGDRCSYSSSDEYKNGNSDDDEDTSSWWYHSHDEDTSSVVAEDSSGDEDDYEDVSVNDEEESLMAKSETKTYTIFLEYLPRGSLVGVIKNSPNGDLPERQVRHYTKFIPRGLAVIHAKGYAHYDVKLKTYS